MASSSNRRLGNTAAAALVLALSLALLAYVGIGEAFRTYPRFELARLAAQGEVMSTALEPFLLAGLPLEQFPGFAPLSQPLLSADASIGAVMLRGPAGQTLFGAGGTVDAAAFRSSPLAQAALRYTITESDRDYRVSLPLRNKFEQVGALELTTPRAAISGRITARFAPLALIAGLLVVLFAGCAFVLSAPAQATRLTRRLELAYGVAFLAMALAVITILIGLYADGIRGKTTALARSLAGRLSTPLALGLELDDFSGLDATLQGYRTLNPDLGFVALTRDDTIVIHTDAQRVGQAWQSPPGFYEDRVDHADRWPSGGGAAGDSAHSRLRTAVAQRQKLRGAVRRVGVYRAAAV